MRDIMKVRFMGEEITIYIEAPRDENWRDEYMFLYERDQMNEEKGVNKGMIIICHLKRMINFYLQQKKYN